MVGVGIGINVNVGIRFKVMFGVVFRFSTRVVIKSRFRVRGSVLGLELGDYV